MPIYLNKGVLLFIAAQALLSGAQAENKAEVTINFQYDETAPIEEVYKGIEEAAADACDVDYTAVVAFDGARVTRKCQSEITAQLVDALDNQSLTQYHASIIEPNKTGFPQSESRILAQLED